MFPVLVRLPFGEGDLGVTPVDPDVSPDGEKISGLLFNQADFSHQPLCKGRVSKLDVSKTKSALRCEKCGMRLLVPSTLQNVGALWTHLEKTYFDKP